MPDDDPKHAERWDAVEEATELLRDGDHEGAARELRAVLDGDPQNPYAHHFLGAVHFERGDFADAQTEYERAIALAPQYLGAVVALGHALRMQGKLDDAIRTGERALTMAGESGDPDARYLLGLTYAARGNTHAAIENLEAFLASNPEVEARYEAEAMLDTLKGKAKPLTPV
jgi:tetratricopeptide (TPR) repeat protein